MHPAFSVLFFTVTSGVGYGLMMTLILSHLTGTGSLSQPGAIVGVGIFSLILISAGLLSSTFHLANPKNAWRAFSRFKTSWLSREGVFAVIYYPFALLYLLLAWLAEGAVTTGIQIVGSLTLALGLITVFTTSMIYASLKTIRQWHNALTPINYILFSTLSGLLFFNAASALLNGELSSTLILVTLITLVLSAIAKFVYFYWIGKPAGTTIKTATTFTNASVRLFDTGHSADNFLQKEFSYKVGPQTLTTLRWLCLLMCFVIPFVITYMQASTTIAALAAIAALLCYGGLLIERWLFFAEAKHVVRLFYGDKQV